MVLKECVNCRGIVPTTSRERNALKLKDLGWCGGVLAKRTRAGKKIHIWSHYKCSTENLITVPDSKVCECGHHKQAHVNGRCTSVHNSGRKKSECECVDFYPLSKLKYEGCK